MDRKNDEREGAFLVMDNQGFNGPLGGSLHSFTRTTHSLHSLPRGTDEIHDNVFTLKTHLAGMDVFLVITRSTPRVKTKTKNHRPRNTHTWRKKRAKSGCEQEERKKIKAGYSATLITCLWAGA